MELMGVAQELTRLLTHEPTGRPGFVSTAIRRSLVVAYYGARYVGLRQVNPFAVFVGSTAVAIGIGRALAGHFDPEAAPAPLTTQLLVFLAFMGLFHPLIRRLRLIL